MIKPPSLQGQYSHVFSGDPALSLPTDDTERENVLRVAHETGRWADICKAGELPTVFQLMSLPGHAFTWLGGETRRRRLAPLEQWELAVRLALRGFENFGPHGKVKTVINADGFELAGDEAIDAIYSVGGELGRAIVTELGALIIKRCLEGVPPKS